SKTTILLSNALYKFIDNNTLDFKNEYTSLVGTSTQDDKKLFAKELEQYVLITDLGKTALTTNQINTINTKIWNDNNLNQTLTKTKTTSDTVSDIWNIGLNVSANQSVSDFDIAVNIVKSSSGTIGNIVIEGISIANNSLTAANKVSIFGKKTSGSTSSIAYDSTKNITKNAVALVQGKLLIDLGYIIKNQDVVSESSFTNASDYAVTVYVTKLDTSNTAITSNTSVQTTASTSLTIPSGSQKITGTISVVGAN
ncbi:hypothetical protein, partial [Poseidonibacter sp.]|uniref:hypothetical protein n=1 Tax=Poseidonibacter sp. TaxID=2321188 RepID=UPI003C70BC9F